MSKPHASGPVKNVVLVDDQMTVSDLRANMPRSEPSFTCVGSGSRPGPGVAIVDRLQPDRLLVDVPRGHGERVVAGQEQTRVCRKPRVAVNRRGDTAPIQRAEQAVPWR